MEIVDAYAERKKKEIMQETWGHLAPQHGRKYTGFFTYAVGCYGGLGAEITSCKFKGLDDSPWFYDTLQEFASTLDMETGYVYRFDGNFVDGIFNGRVIILLNTN